MTSDPLAIISAPTAAVRPSWIALSVDAASVAKARRFAADVMRDYVTDAGHVDDIVLVVSELVTNARRAAIELRRWESGELPLRFGVVATERYVHLYVTDPDPRPIGSASTPVNGWGLGIVDTYAAARWTTYTEHDKTIHALITAPAITLDAAEMEGLLHG